MIVNFIWVKFYDVIQEEGNATAHMRAERLASLGNIKILLIFCILTLIIDLYDLYFEWSCKFWISQD